jgi:NAD(P)-dependent dehydrogenase (short-subunit alcohol dehydrogenase family)
MGQLTGKVLIAAGASRGIGKAIALACAREGAKVAVLAREGVTKLPGSVGETADEIVKAGGVARGYACDIADSAAVNAMVAKVEAELGPIDIVINSTATFAYASTVETSDADWERVFATNTKGAFFLTRAVLPSMLKRRSGHIIHLTGSGAREISHMPAMSGSSKAALERFSLGLAWELREQNIAVNLFDPGPVKTERSYARLGDAFDWTGFAAAADVAPAAVHLAAQTPAQANGRIFSYADYARGVRLS